MLWPTLPSVAPITGCLSSSPSPIIYPQSFPEADPMQAGLGAGVVFQPHQPNCSSFPAHKWYKVWSCTSQCPNFNHLSTLIDTNGFYKCKSLSSSKLHVFEKTIARTLPGKCSPNILKAGREPSIPKPCAFAQQSLKRLGCYY